MANGQREKQYNLSIIKDVPKLSGSSVDFGHNIISSKKLCRIAISCLCPRNESSHRPHWNSGPDFSYTTLATAFPFTLSNSSLYSFLIDGPVFFLRFLEQCRCFGRSFQETAAKVCGSDRLKENENPRCTLIENFEDPAEGTPSVSRYSFVSQAGSWLRLIAPFFEVGVWSQNIQPFFSSSNLPSQADIYLWDSTSHKQPAVSVFDRRTVEFSACGRERHLQHYRQTGIWPSE